MKINPLPSKEDLDKRFDYCEETGNLYNKNTTKIVGCLDRHGYLRVFFNKKTYLAHRLIWKIIYNKDPYLIDHINGIRDDNCISNLRECNYSQNARNCKKYTNNSTGYKGVTCIKLNKRYKAQINIKGSSRTIGYYNTAEEAYKAYCLTARLVFADFYKES